MLSKYLRKPCNSFDNPGDYDVFENIAHFHFHKISAFLLFFEPPLTTRDLNLASILQ